MTKRPSRNRRGLAAGCALGFLWLCGAGCGGPAGEVFPPLKTPIVWPAPPEPGRVRFVGMISTEESLRRKTSWTQGLGALIFGRPNIGVMKGPSAVALGSPERLYVADGPGRVVHVFNLTSRRYEQFSSLGPDQTLMMPVALTVVEEQLYVVDSVLHQVCMFDKTGRFRGGFGSERLIRPGGIAYCPRRERLYVSDAGAHVVQVFDKNGRFLHTIGSRGVEPGQFNFPTHLWVDHQGKLYVSDTLNYRVQVFSEPQDRGPEGPGTSPPADGGRPNPDDGRQTPDPGPPETFGGHGDRPGYFAHPAGVATDSLGHIYVIDRQFENVQIFDREGKVLMALGHEGSGVGEFWLPSGIFVDDRDRIYVADSFNKRVQVFELLEASEDDEGL